MKTNDADCSADASIHRQDATSPPSEKTEIQNGFIDLVTDDPKVTEVAIKARDLTGQALDFLSHASNETLGACIVALCATTWLILGRVGLILIGVVTGVILHATWEGNIRDEGSSLEVNRRREKGLDVAARVLDWREKKDKEAESDRGIAGDIDSRAAPHFSGFQKETATALENLTDAITRDYVKFWYSPLLPEDEAFPAACQHVLTGFLVAVSSHLSRKRPADTFLDFLTNSSSIVIVFLSGLSAAVRGLGSSGSASEAVNQFLDANPSSSLASILDRNQQKRKLKGIAEEIMRSYVESSAYACGPVRIFLREILAGVILDMTIRSCSRAEFINDWIIYSLEEGNTELLDAFDAGVEGATTNGHVKPPGQSANDERSSSEAAIQDEPIKGSKAISEHRRTVSRAEDAMEEAMREAKRLSELIAAEEAKKQQTPDHVSSSEVSTTGEVTPTSWRDELSAVIDNTALPDPETQEVTVLSDEAESKGADPVASFTTFDQIISSQQPTALTAPPLTLHNASVSIFDDSVPGEKGSLRSKPTVDYLLQVEPSTSQYPGWMIARTYSDFETLHEVLRRISVISGVATFAERHQALPMWKNQTKAKLRQELESYLQDALSFQRLAESEGMKRFLEKDQGIGRASPGTNKGGFGFPSPAAFETMGKGMLDVLSSAPKGAAGGGKAILGGVTGVFGGGQKRQSVKSPAGRANTQSGALSNTPSVLVQSDTESNASARPSMTFGRESQDSLRQSTNIIENERPPPLPHRQGQRSSLKANDEVQHVNDTSVTPHLPPQEAPNELQPERNSSNLQLPPPPSEITDDYKQSQTPPTFQSSHITNPSTLTSEDSSPAPPKPPRRSTAPLTSQETSVAVELFFATINELYTLSSAWTLRLTLLNAAKTFLLRPGNPNLEAIRQLLQTTVIDANTTDAGIAARINKIRQNALPTEEELKKWPPPSSEEEKERKRVRARKLLVERGMPQALTSVMGAAASGEALGRVFDCLQVEEVARGLVFSLVVQGVRAVTQ
ncbi:hypothetical protein ACLMJK_009573 [Lecanora helva]